MQLVRAAQIETSMQNLFDDFWLLYPRKEGKKECRLVWDRIPESEHIAILEAVVAWRQAWTAQARSTNYIKMPREWLILERWNDEIPPELVRKHASSNGNAVPITNGGEARSGSGQEDLGGTDRAKIPAHVQAVLDRLKAKR